MRMKKITVKSGTYPQSEGYETRMVDSAEVTDGHDVLMVYA